MDSRLIRSTLNIVVLLATIGVLSCGGAVAQTATDVGVRHTESARHLIEDFEESTGAGVVTNDDLDLDANVIVPAQGFADRAQELDTVGAALNARWQKVYLVEPANASKPIVRLSDAKAFTDGQGTVSFDSQGLSASAAIAAAAQADGATAVVSGPLPNDLVSLNASNLSVPQAITAVSAQTGTNWQLTYRFTPRASDDATIASSATDGTLIPRYMRREHTQLATDATTEMPDYYEPFYVHAPADAITYDPYGEVLYSPSEDGGAHIPTMPQVISPVGTGIMSMGYNGAVSSVTPTTPYMPYVPPVVAVPTAAAPAATTTTTTTVPANSAAAPATTTTTTTASPSAGTVVVP